MANQFRIHNIDHMLQIGIIPSKQQFLNETEVTNANALGVDIVNTGHFWRELFKKS